MFKSDNILDNWGTTQNLYCVWIRADETPSAPLIAVWMDTKMRAFEGSGEAAAKLPANVEPVSDVLEDGPAVDKCRC
jgi:hypothetical protein